MLRGVPLHWGPGWRALLRAAQDAVEILSSPLTPETLTPPTLTPPTLTLQDAVEILSNPAAEPEHLATVLGALQVLVEPIDNANSGCRGVEGRWCGGGGRGGRGSWCGLGRRPVPAGPSAARQAVRRLGTGCRLPQRLCVPVAGIWRCLLPADLRGMGGIPPLLAALRREGSPGVQAAAAYVLGTAAANNPVFQQHLLEEAPATLQQLTQVLA